MKKLILLQAIILLIPNILAANINVNIIISKNDAERKSHATGSDTNVINNMELETFQLYDGKLKDAIEAYHGKQPDDVYVKSRTPWGDLYTTYNWPQVQRTLTAIKTEILSIDYAYIEVLTEYINNTKKEDDIKKIRLLQALENTVESNWQNNAELTGINVHYDIDIKTDYSESALRYDSLWGESVNKSEKIVIGPPNDVQFSLKPGQRAKAVMKVNKGTLKIKIDYEAKLDGYIAVNYNVPFKGHHFTALEVNDVITAGGLSRTVPLSEILTVVYYPEFKVIVEDVDTKEMLKIL